MESKQEILSSIKLQIEKVLPNARIFLFGSRANGRFTEESDWDILVLSDEPVTLKVKQSVHNTFFSLSVLIGSFINTIIIYQKDWQQNPSYYSLRKTIASHYQAL